MRQRRMSQHVSPTAGHSVPRPRGGKVSSRTLPSATRTAGPFDEYTVRDLRLSKFALTFASGDVEHWYRLAKCLRALPIATSLTTLFTVHNMVHTYRTWDRADAPDVLQWASIVQSSVNVVALATLSVLCVLSTNSERRREALRWRLAWVYDVAVCVQIATDIWGAALFAAVDGGYTTVPPVVFFAIAAPSLTGLPWYQHALLGLVAFLVFLVGRTFLSVYPFQLGTQLEAFVILVPTMFLAYTCDASSRTDFQTRLRLRLFRRELVRGSEGGGRSNSQNNRVENQQPETTQKIRQTKDFFDPLLLNNSEIDRLDNLDSALHQAHEITHMYSASEAGKSFFLAAMAHELRSPLSSVVGYASLIMSNPSAKALDLRAREYIANIRSSSDHLLHLVNKILDFSRLAADTPEQRFPLEPQMFNVRAMVSSMIRMFHPTACDKGVKLIGDCKGVASSTVLWGDNTRIQQIIVNFMGNATKFTQEGQVVLSVSLIEPTVGELEAVGFRRQDDDCVITDQNGEKLLLCGHVWLRITVSDTGIGMDEATIERLFYPFEQAAPGVQRKFGGSGLGLCISAQLAELMGGRSIEVVSSPGEGSTFSTMLLLPTVESGGEAFSRTEAIRTLDVIYAGAAEADDASAAVEKQSLSVGSGVDPASDNGPVPRLSARDLWEGLFDSGAANPRARVQISEQNSLPTWIQVSPKPSVAASADAESTSSCGSELRGEDPAHVGFEFCDASESAEAGSFNCDPTAEQSHGEANHSPSTSRSAPRQPEPDVDGDDRVNPPQPLPLVNVLVLLVDDVAMMRKLGSLMLSHAGASVETASDGVEAVEKVDAARQAGRPFDVVLMDRFMPKCDGISATEQILAAKVDSVPVVIGLTGDTLGAAEDFANAGAAAVLVKPYSLPDVVTAIAQHMDLPQ